jgi:hemolysin activation/secretion protein
MLLGLTLPIAMFAESRSSRPKVNLLRPTRRNIAFVIPSDRQVTISNWEFWLCWALISSSQFSISLKLKARSQLWQLWSQSFLCLFVISQNTSSASAQSFDPITPNRPEKPQPQPLAPTQNPIDESLTAPPIPDSVLDIPGTIVVEKFNFAGSTVFSSEELNRAISDFVDKPISFAQLLLAANKITELYVQKGYITSGAYVPEQNLQSGEVNIQIVEGSLADIEVDIVEGRLKPEYIRDRLDSATSTPLNIKRLQEALQILQLNPLISSLDAELSAGIKPGTNYLAVSVVGADSFKIQAQLNNNRNSSIGTFERGIELSQANLLGIGDGISVSYNNTDGSNQFAGSYTLPINARNGSLGFNIRISDSQIIEPPFESADIEISSRDFDFIWRQPVIQKATPKLSQELALDLTASRRESNTSILDVDSFVSPGANDNGETRTTALRFGQEWLQRDPRQVFSARSQFNIGIDAFDANINDDEPNSQFFAWQGQLLYLRLLGTAKGKPAIGPTALLRSDLQLSADPLISTEQFSLGGSTTVRGYRQDALLTDNGIYTTAEIRLPIARIPKLSGTLQVNPFIDFGVGWNTDGESTDFNTLVGTGLGLLWQTEDQFAARIDWGIPLVNSDSENSTWQENGVYFQVEYNLFK